MAEDDRDTALASASQRIQSSLSARELLARAAQLALANAQRYAHAKRDQERLQLFAHAADEALWDWDLATDELFWTSGIQTLLGAGVVQPERSLQWRYTRIHPEDRPGVRASFERALASTQTSWRAEYRFERASGAWAVVEDRAHFLRDPAGKAFRIIGAVRDLTALRSATQRLTAVAENATLALFLMDASQHCAYMNPAAERMTGVPLELARGRPLHDLVHHTRPDGRPYPLEECPIDRALPQRIRQSGEEVFVRPDGTFYPVAFTASPLLENDAPVGTVIEVRDITEEKRHEAERTFLLDASVILAASLDDRTTLQRLAEAAVATIADGCFVDLVDRAGVLCCVAAASVEAGPTRRAEEPLRAGSAVHHGRQPDPTAHEVLRTGAPRLLERPRLALEGRGGRVPEGARSQVAVPLLAHERVMGVLTAYTLGGRAPFSAQHVDTWMDLGRRVAMAAENARLYAEATEAIQVRDDFLSVASHELKTPLTPLQLQLHTIGRQLPSLAKDDASRRWLEERVEILRRQGHRLHQLVNGLLDITRIMGGRLVLESTPLDFAQVVREAIDELTALGELSRAGAEVRIDAPSELPGRWDRLRLGQIVTNLVSNALKYGEGKPIEVALRAEGAEAVLTVVDRGIGMTPEVQARVFNRFERGVSSRNYGGLGLGLYIVHQIVEAMGGEISLASRPGGGAAFTVRLPRVGARPEETGARGEQEPKLPAAP